MLDLLTFLLVPQETPQRTTQAVRIPHAMKEKNLPDKIFSLRDYQKKCLKTPAELLDYAEYAWVGLGKGGYRLGLTGGNALVVAPTILDKWEVQLHQRGREKTMMIKTDLRSAIWETENFVKDKFRDLLPLVKLHTRWRSAPATEKQINVIRSKKINVPDGLTKGQASHLIGMLS